MCQRPLPLAALQVNAPDVVERAGPGMRSLRLLLNVQAGLDSIGQGFIQVAAPLVESVTVK